MKDLYSAVAVLDFYFPGTFQAQKNHGMYVDQILKRKLLPSNGFVYWFQLREALKLTIMINMDLENKHG